jgi:CheY-like chemotaxis protein
LQILSHAIPGYKILLIDLSSPNLESLELAMRVRERFHLGPDSNKPLTVALTTNSDRFTRERCASLGIDYVVGRPLTPDKMRNILNELFMVGFS